MITGTRGLFLLVVSLLFFLVIVALLSLSTVMRPGRWSERPRIGRGDREETTMFGVVS